MKELMFLVLIIPMFCYAQNPIPKPQSKIEDLSSKAGVLLKKSFIDVGKVKSVEFQILEVTDLASSRITKGLRIETPETGSYASGSARVLIDQDEVGGLLKVLNRFKEIIETPAPENDVEYVFTSTAGFRAVLFNYKKSWHFNIQIDKYNSKSQPYWNGTDELDNVIEIVSKANAQLN